jgi:hypothetical protein
MDAEPSLKNWPRVSFSRHMSRIARAVFPVTKTESNSQYSWLLGPEKDKKK